MLRWIALLVMVQTVPALAQNGDQDPTSLVTIQCGDATTNARMGQLVSTVIRESLEKFAELNPRVQGALYSRLTSRELGVVCDDAALERIGAEADAKGSVFGPYRIRVRSDVSKNTILHELLHFAKIDNFSGRAHTNVDDLGTLSQDNVYACADAVYPAVFIHDPVSALDAEETCENAL